MIVTAIATDTVEAAVGATLVTVGEMDLRSTNGTRADRAVGIVVIDTMTKTTTTTIGITDVRTDLETDRRTTTERNEVMAVESPEISTITEISRTSTVASASPTTTDAVVATVEAEADLVARGTQGARRGNETTDTRTVGAAAPVAVTVESTTELRTRLRPPEVDDPSPASTAPVVLPVTGRNDLASSRNVARPSGELLNLSHGNYDREGDTED